MATSKSAQGSKSQKQSGQGAGNEATRPLQALVPYTYVHNGEEKTGWTQVGVAFKRSGGEGHTIELRPGISVSGRIVLMPFKSGNGEKGADDQEAAAAAAAGGKRFQYSATARPRDSLV